MLSSKVNQHLDACFPVILEGSFEFRIPGLLGGLCWNMVTQGRQALVLSLRPSASLPIPGSLLHALTWASLSTVYIHPLRLRHEHSRCGPPSGGGTLGSGAAQVLEVAWGCLTRKLWGPRYPERVLGGGDVGFGYAYPFGPADSVTGRGGGSSWTSAR